MSPSKVWKKTFKFFQTKFSRDNLAEDLMKPYIWRKTFKFFPVIELVKLRQVCSTFKKEIDFLFATQTKLGIWGSRKPIFEIEFCQDPLHDIPNSSWIRMETSFIEHLSTLKSLFPSVKVLCIHYQIECEIEKVLGAFVGLECLVTSDYVVSLETTSNFVNLKHLITAGITGGQMLSLPSLESLEISYDFKTINQWLQLNVGLPLKRFEIGWFSDQLDLDFSLQCLSCLPSSLEYLKTGDSMGYTRQFKPLFPRLKEVERLGGFEYSMDIVTAFIDFLKDHSSTLKKVSMPLNDINVEQLEKILSCLSCGTNVTLDAWDSLEETDYVRRFIMIIGKKCRKKNLVLNMTWDGLCSTTLDEILRFVDILPPETQSLQLHVHPGVHGLMFTNQASCRRYIQGILASPLKLAILRMYKPTEEIRRAWTSAIQGLPGTHEAVLEFFEPKPQRVIIRRKN